MTQAEKPADEPPPPDLPAVPTLEEAARERVRAALLRYKPKSKPKFRRW